MRKLLLGIALTFIALPAVARHHEHHHHHRYEYPRTYIPAVRPHWSEDRSYYDRYLYHRETYNDRYYHHDFRRNDYRFLCNNNFIVTGQIYAQTRNGYIVLSGRNRYNNCVSY